MSAKPITALYQLESEFPQEAVRALTRGQSVGNPTILTKYETHEFLERWEATGRIEKNSQENMIYARIQWPAHNFGHEGFNYLLSVLMGGQCDIDLIQSCRLIELDLAAHTRFFPGPRYGLHGIRTHLNVWNRPLIGGIIKPKIGLTPLQLTEIVKQLADGGCDFIKEDEILADQPWCPMQERLPLVAKALHGYQILYATCITGDGSEVWKKARRAEELGATAVHANLWCGLGTYRDVRSHVKLPLFFQKSGDKVWTTGHFAINYDVLCQLIRLAGCDFAHIGMYGGYLAESVGTLKKRMAALAPAIPSFSCGMTPALAEQIQHLFGNDLMLTSGGYVHSHPEGIAAGVKAIRDMLHATVASV